MEYLKTLHEHPGCHEVKGWSGEGDMFQTWIIAWQPFCFFTSAMESHLQLFRQKKLGGFGESLLEVDEFYIPEQKIPCFDKLSPALARRLGIPKTEADKFVINSHNKKPGK